MTGTSVDGLDLALIEIEGAEISLLAQNTLAFPHSLRNSLIRLGHAEGDCLDVVGEADAALGRFIGEAIRDFIAACGPAKPEVHAIGSHGQTVRHRPDGKHPFSIQIGDPNLIAEITRLTTVADFRRRDLAAGGQGAPLAPGFHAAIMGGVDERRVVLNIGGISNITLLGKPLGGFDTGPGNALMDEWCVEHRAEAFDENGAWAATGKVHEPLLRSLRGDPYFAKTPPKSTGREHFNLKWLKPRLRPGLRPEDVQRTLLELTAASIVDAIKQWAPGVERVVVCGGGRRNNFLLQRLSELAGVPVDTIDAHDWNGDAVEAAAFAWLAHQRLTGATANAMGVTGARGHRVLGAVYAP